MRALAGATLAVLSGAGIAAAPGADPGGALQAATDDARQPSDPASVLALGRAWPSGYGTANLPPYMIVHYGLDAQGEDWRAADRTIYRIDPETRAITAFAAMITNDRFTVGESVPAGYDIYNIPIAHRGQWPDGPNALYRYADGRIYRIDPRTRTVMAAIDIPAIPAS